MSYIDDQMKRLLKRQTKAIKLNNNAGQLRQEAHEAIDKALANAILKGSYLSIGIWSIPDTYLADHNGPFSLNMTTPVKTLNKSWGSIIHYMSEYCYRVHLSKGITLINHEDGLEIQAEDHNLLSALIKKYGVQVVYPDLDTMIESLNDRLEFIKDLKSKLSAVKN